jgi:Xaa-Pro aminopeptidase
MKEAKLIVASSEQSADLYYTTRFFAPDAFIFTQIDGRKILIMSDLEIDRAKEQSAADEVLSYSTLQAEAKKKSNGPVGMTGVIDHFFKTKGISNILVPPGFPVAMADALREKGYALAAGKEPFFPERMVKRADEIAAIKKTIAATESAIKTAIDLIAQSDIHGDELWLRGKPLTSELVRKTMHLSMMGDDCLAKETIVAGGTQACDPHCIGFGPLKAHWPIVLDVFPVSSHSHYYADITRTVVKGKPSDKAKTMYRIVREGQEIAFKMLKPGVDGKAIHDAILAHFEKNGFKTGLMNGRMQGFFHGTGHGLGLEIHEAPRVGGVSDILQEGQVVTVEPGLYYLDAGGIRIEDDVLITKTGCEILTTFPRQFELE